MLKEKNKTKSIVNNLDNNYIEGCIFRVHFIEILVYYLWSVYVWAIIVKYTHSGILNFYLKPLLVFSDLTIIV